MPPTGSDLVASALEAQGVDDFFYLMGAPMLSVESAALSLGLRGIDVRHEQAASIAAHAWARLRRRPGVCMAASGPGTTNLITGVAHAWADGTPLVVLGGAAPLGESGKGPFQEIDQVSMLKPCTKWAEQVRQPERIPELVARAFAVAMSGRPGPVYLDLPADVLFAEVDEATIGWPAPWFQSPRPRPVPSADELAQLAGLIAEAKRPVALCGSGVLWSQAEDELQGFLEVSGIPFYTTPQSRGMVAEDHPLAFLTSRSTAFREADLIMIFGTRMNYIIGHAAPPRFAADARLVRIDIDPKEIATPPRPLDLGLTADLKATLPLLTDTIAGQLDENSFADWRHRLATLNRSKVADQEEVLATSSTPIHPLRLCRELRDVLPRNAVLCVDGQEILNYARQVIPTHMSGHRLNSGTFGTMGVGLPLGLGARVACRDNPVVVLHGDGSFGMNAMETDTLVRHGLPLLIVVSLNGGWTGDPDRERPGRDLGYTRYHLIAEALGAVGELVEKPEEIGPALKRGLAAVRDGRVALVNVVTDWRARATTAPFTRYVT